jgi:hypothetical protein
MAQRVTSAGGVSWVHANNNSGDSQPLLQFAQIRRKVRFGDKDQDDFISVKGLFKMRRKDDAVFQALVNASLSDRSDDKIDFTSTCIALVHSTALYAYSDRP